MHSAGQILNLFNEEQLTFIKKVLSKIPTHKQGSLNYSNGFTESDTVYKIIDNFIGDILEKSFSRRLHIACGFYLKEIYPVDIHTDYDFAFNQGRTPDLAILIPLEIISKSDQMTHTVIFDQISKTKILEFSNVIIKNNAKDIYNTYCSHINEENLEYVTTKAIYPWTPGSLIYWDRELLHCSDNFLKNNISEKHAMILHTVKEIK